MKTTVFNRLKGMNLRNFIVLTLLRVAFPESTRKAKAIVLLPLVDADEETPGQHSQALDRALSRSLCIDPWHPTPPGQFVAQLLGSKSLRIPKHAPKKNAPEVTPTGHDAWGFATNSPVIG
jgi:hypothetical protein